MNEQELREQIAKQIETAHAADDDKNYWCGITINYCSCREAASIARGTYEK